MYTEIKDFIPVSFHMSTLVTLNTVRFVGRVFSYGRQEKFTQNYSRNMQMEDPNMLIER
jgi:hypothetical protein